MGSETRDGRAAQLSDGVAELAAALAALPARRSWLPGSGKRLRRGLDGVREGITAYGAEYATVAARHEELTRNARHLIAVIGAPVADLEPPALAPVGDGVDRRDVRRVLSLLNAADAAAARRDRRTLAVALPALHEAAAALVEDFRTVLLAELDQAETLVARLVAEGRGGPRLRAVPRDGWNTR